MDLSYFWFSLWSGATCTTRAEGRFIRIVFFRFLRLRDTFWIDWGQIYFYCVFQKHAPPNQDKKKHPIQHVDIFLSSDIGSSYKQSTWFSKFKKYWFEDQCTYILVEVMFEQWALLLYSSVFTVLGDIACDEEEASCPDVILDLTTLTVWTPWTLWTVWTWNAFPELTPSTAVSVSLCHFFPCNMRIANTKMCLWNSIAKHF